jgi:DNA polymerase-3 subunit delta'
MVLMPETESLERNWPLSEAAQDDLDKKKRKPSKEIRVDAVREVVQFSQRTAGTAHGKVVVVFPAEQMNAVSANTLLKTLEEPPGDLRFILSTTSIHQLLPTVRSRCIAHAMSWPPNDEAVNWLAQGGFSPSDAQHVLRFCGGRPLDAWALQAQGITGPMLEAFPQSVKKGDLRFFTQAGPRISLDALQKLCHDLWRVQSGAAPRYFEAGGLPAAPSGRVLMRWAKALTDSAKTVDHPFGSGLMLEAWAQQAQTALSTNN